jgi:hypothetical protein
VFGVSVSACASRSTIRATLRPINLCFAVHERCVIQFAASMQLSKEKLQTGEPLSAGRRLEDGPMNSRVVAGLHNNVCRFDPTDHFTKQFTTPSRGQPTKFAAPTAHNAKPERLERK